MKLLALALLLAGMMQQTNLSPWHDTDVGKYVCMDEQGHTLPFNPKAMRLCPVGYFFAFTAQSVSVEPLDVPAVQETRTVSLPANSKEGTNGRECALVGLDALSQECKFDIKVWTCSDKTRILEHDEQTPPKYWCRKPQP